MAAIDDGRLDLLVARGEQAEWRAETIMGVDLLGLADSLGALQSTIAELRERIARAEGNGSGRPDSVAALAASLRLTEAEADRLRERLYERLAELGVAFPDAEPVTPHHPAPAPWPHHPAPAPRPHHPAPAPRPHHPAPPPPHAHHVAAPALPAAIRAG